MNDITIYMRITDPKGHISLSAGFDPERNEYYAPSLKFGKKHTLGKAWWDNEKYIFEIFYPFLKRWQERTLTEEDKKEFPDWKKMTEEEYFNAIDVLEQGIKFKWNEIE